MSSRGRYEDFTTLLYLVPLVGGIAYAAVLWAQSGLSALLPTAVYLTVTRDPVFFILASLSVLLGVMVEVNGTEPSGRQARLAALGRTMQSIAFAALVVALLSAWYANGFTDLGGAATDFMIGRYGLVFPAMMVLFSYLLTARFRLGALADRRAVGLIALLLVPPVIYEIGKRELAAGLGVALVLMAAGLYSFFSPGKKGPAPKEE